MKFFKNFYVVLSVALISGPALAAPLHSNIENFEIDDPVTGTVLNFSNIQFSDNGTITYEVSQMDLNGQTSTPSSVQVLLDPHRPVGESMEQLHLAQLTLAEATPPTAAPSHSNTKCLVLSSAGGLMFVGSLYLLGRAINGTLNIGGLIALADGIVIALGVGYFGVAACKN